MSTRSIQKQYLFVKKTPEDHELYSLVTLCSCTFQLSHTTAGGSQGDGKSDNESDFGEGGEETLLGQGVGEQHGNGSFPSTIGLGKYLPVFSHMLMCTCMNTLLSNLDGSESTIGDLVEGSSGTTRLWAEL